MKRNILLNPGPATTTETVKLAQVVPDICPREAEFGALMEFVSEGLTSFVANPKDYTSVLFGGSGTAGVEAVLSSVIGEDEGVLIVNNGAYGARMCQICDAYGIHYVEFKSSKIEPINLEELEACIKEHQGFIQYLAVIHNETTTGLLNDLDPLAELTRKYGLTFIVDAMSSYAAIPIHMAKQNISYLVASSNKNIQGMAGVVFAICNKQKLQELKDKKKRNFYLDLYAQYEYFQKTKQLRFTPPVQTLYALKQAIIELQEETVEGRYERYTDNWETLLEGITRLGLTYLVAKEHHSHIITTILEPDCEGYSFDGMHDYLYARGYTIYPGKIGENNTFRIANIGALDRNDIKEFLECLEKYLIGIKFIK